MKHALIVGSAPISEGLREANLDEFTRIAISRSWELRKDFDIHVGLDSIGNATHATVGIQTVSD